MQSYIALLDFLLNVYHITNWEPSLEMTWMFRGIGKTQETWPYPQCMLLVPEAPAVFAIYKSCYWPSSVTKDSKDMSQFSYSLFYYVKQCLKPVTTILDRKTYCEMKISFIDYEEFDL